MRKRLDDEAEPGRLDAEAARAEPEMTADDLGVDEDIDLAQFEPIEETHPGFTIVCDDCGSEAVAVENDLEYSAEEGRQGNVYLRCTECDAETILLPPADEEE